VPDFSLSSINSLPKQVYSGLCSPNQVMFEVTMSPAQQVASVLLFTRIEDASSGAKTGWDPGLSMNPQGSGIFRLTVNTGSLNGANLYSSAYLDYQFVATDTHGKVLDRSQVFNDIQLNRCGIIFLPRPIIIITPTNTPQIVK
jgi:hypothetical protein